MNTLPTFGCKGAWSTRQVALWERKAIECECLAKAAHSTVLMHFWRSQADDARGRAMEYAAVARVWA